MPIPFSVWNRQKRFLVLLPGLIAPAAVVVVCIWSFVHEAIFYFSLPLAERADGDPLSADAGMFFAAFGIAVGMLLFLPPLVAGLPRRLRPWVGIAAVVPQLLPLLAAGDEAKAGVALGWVALVLFAYVPALIVVRLILQRRVGTRPIA